ncbi:MAG: hypothetical protein HZC55_05005 [Verrucomicrobia bacterium]|nr:hypothetical protein [Verrucomicrobiota bacterium]
MPALALSFVFVGLLAFVGRATLAALAWQGGVLRTWLLAPAVGLAVVLLGTMTLNQAGLPVRTLAWPLTLVLLVAAGAVFRWRRPLFPGRALRPFVVVAICSLLWTGWPHFRFNFDWLSYVNDDFVNYCLAAERFKDFGFWRAPQLEELAGRDITQYYWFMHVPGLMRFGSELTIAWYSSLTGIKSLHIFMPVILGLGVIQLSATAALVLHRGRWRRRALFAMALLAISPLFMLGTLYQLIAQVGGVGLLLAATAILTSRLPAQRRRLFPAIATLSLLGSGLAIFYPEVTAFAVLAAVVCTALESIRARSWPVVRLSLFLYGIVGVILLLRHNLLSYVFTILLQMGQGFRSVDLSLSLFPYFMIPTGLANLFGLMPLSVNYPEPYTSLAILAGAVALAAALFHAIREGLRGVPVGVLLVVQAALALKLMTSGNDFGLYKNAMFMQPALAAALAALLLRLPWSRFTAPAAVVLAAVCCAPTALHYTGVSQGEKAGGLTEAKNASALGTRVPPVAPGTRLLCDINNLVAAKVAAFELRGTDLRYLSRDYYQQIAPIEFERLGDTLIRFHPRFDDLMRTRRMLADRDTATVRTHNLFDTTFSAPALEFGREGKTDAYLTLDESLGLFNKLHVPPETPATGFFKTAPAGSKRNHLVFMHTGRGNHYYLGDRNRIAIYQQEADPYTRRQDITGMGRFLLLRVERPDTEFYLRLCASKTFMGEGHTGWSPGSRILGATDVPLAFPGNGAVNRIVGPIRPVVRDGAAYIAIDFNETPTQFLPRRSGLQALYNTKVPLDSRKLVAYGRDISALSAAEVAALERPARLQRFPQDLVFARGLEYSGIYEDGWLSPESEFVLAGAPASGIVRVRGFVPELAGIPSLGGTLIARVGDQEFTLPTAQGAFDWLLPVPAAAPTTRLRLHFLHHGRLPGDDARPAGGKLELIDVLPALPTHTFDFGTPGGARLPASGIDQDGWMARTATIELPAGGKRVLALKVEYPDWSGKGAGRLTVALPATGASREETLPPGSYSRILLPVPASSRLQTVTLSAGDDFPLPAPDQRRRAARLVSAELQPASE